jgi:hypothetical protein
MKAFQSFDFSMPDEGFSISHGWFRGWAQPMLPGEKRFRTVNTQKQY